MGRISVRLSEHAFKKVVRGEAPADFIEKCLFTGDKERNNEPNKFKAQKRFRRGELVVVHKDAGEKFFVITACWKKRD